MKYIFIHIVIRDGEREHDHKVLTTTNCENIKFAVDWYTAHFWGYGERDFKDDNWYFWGGEICGRWKTYEELTKKEFNFLNKYL